MRKAFDTVKYAILISKLRCYGMRGIALDYFLTDCLKNRKQCVRLRDSFFLYE